MAESPTFNLKTGADSDIVVAREVTASGSTQGKITYRDGFYRSPYLARRTGDSIKGTTENIESNELKHGRTKSAPRKGASSSEGSLDIEFSPESFDDMLEAVFRGEWKSWVSDTASPSNKDNNAYADGYFSMVDQDGNRKARKLIYQTTDDSASDYHKIGLIKCAKPDKVVIHELNSETNDVKYSFLKKFGGATGEDLYQEYAHIAMNTLQLTVAVNAIVTGSFGVMGQNNPKVLGTDAIETLLGGRLSTVGDYTYTACADAATADGTTRYFTGTSDNTGSILTSGTALKNYYTRAVTSDAVKKTAGTAYLGSIPSKACDTMQFTAREGFLYINGIQIHYANNLTFNLDNGLSKKFAIFESTAIAVSPLTLNITGDLKTYLVHDGTFAKKGADALYNEAVADDTIELVFCFQDKLEDPEALYVFQIFNCKHTDNSVDGNGADTLDVSLPWSSFNEQACRVFRIMLPRVTNIEAQEVVASGNTATGNPNLIAILPNVNLNGTAQTGSDITITSTLDGVDNTTAMAFTAPTLVTDKTSDNYGMITASFTAVTQTAKAQILAVTTTWNGKTYTKSFEIPKSA